MIETQYPRQTVITRELWSLSPSPENDELYRPVDPDDPEIQALAESICERGVLDPLVITLDGFIISGHRRYAAARLAGLTSVPCIVEPIRRSDDLDEFVRRLREHNRQRVKTFAETVREELVSTNPDDAHVALLQARAEKPDMSDFAGAEVNPGDQKLRRRISRSKLQMLGAVLRVIEARRDFWPLSDRSIHYALLNNPPLRHAAKPGSRYINDRASYKDLCDLLTRARLLGHVPWDATTDETRPVVTWRAEAGVHSFIRRELDRLFTGYWRNYQQGQANHIELLAEKLTVRPIVEPVAQEFCVPLTIARGYCSILPRREIAERFRKSGRNHLILVMVSDFDPDGESIVQSFVRSMRDDFGIQSISAIKAGLTREQVERFQLPPQMKAKAGSATYDRFTAEHGDDVYELEALDPAELQNAVREAVLGVLDIDAFNHEIDLERKDAAKLEALRRTALRELEKAI